MKATLILSLMAMMFTVTRCSCTAPKPSPPNPAPPAVQAADSAATQPVGRAEDNWPQFRGPTGDGHAADAAQPPATFERPRDLVWKVPLAGEGNSSPVVWGDKLFLTDEDYRVEAFSVATGKPLWQTVIQPPGQHTKPPPPNSSAGMASATACTDGPAGIRLLRRRPDWLHGLRRQPLWAHWLTDNPDNSYGIASSPVPADGLVVQVVDLKMDRTRSRAIRSSWACT